MKEKLKKIINKRFQKIKFKKIILFRNPNEFNHMYIEKVNPNHIGIIWGRRKKQFNKGTNYIRLGKVYFTSIPIIIGLSTIAYINMQSLFFVVCLIGFYTFIIYSISIMLFELSFVLSRKYTPCLEH